MNHLSKVVQLISEEFGMQNHVVYFQNFGHCVALATALTPISYPTHDNGGEGMILNICKRSMKI